MLVTVFVELYIIRTLLSVRQHPNSRSRHRGLSSKSNFGRQQRMENEILVPQNPLEEQIVIYVVRMSEMSMSETYEIGLA